MVDPSTEASGDPQFPLRGLRILEFGGIGPGPFAGMVLGGMGADVVRIDRPGQNTLIAQDNLLVEGRSAHLELDLKAPSGRRRALELVRTADALYEGSRPGVMERLGLGPTECHRLQPRLIYGRMTGWGQTGRHRHIPGHDINYLAATGLLETIGPREAPAAPVNYVADYGAGGMLLVAGILGGFLHLARTGVGTVIDVAMVDGAALMFADLLTRFQAGSWRPERAANEFDGGAPFYRVYATSDDRHMAVGAIEPRFYDQLLRTLELHDLSVTDQHDHARWPETTARICERFRSSSQAQWIERFEGVEACVTAVRTWEEAVEDPHLTTDRGTFVRRRDRWAPAPAPRFLAP